jgi:hypothetical protein
MQPAATTAGWDVATLLSLWERGLAQGDCDRADSLLETFEPAPAPLTLGERTFRLLNLHASLFGRHVDLVSHCPGCGATAQFTADCGALAERIAPKEMAGPHHLLVGDLEVSFRLPASADLVAASSEPDEDAFVRCLVTRCVLSCSRNGIAMPAHAWLDDVFDAVSDRIEALDPGVSVSFALQCPECGRQWRAPLDCGQLLWQKVQTAAERVLLDVDALARAYGWTEAEVLNLSPVRRAAYVQMITT